ncbi:MAG: hypothetical protein HPY62_00570 [Bacteroidales bacterium]|nr:hypothetical protein [Bacteroidales bacterium]
MNSDELNGKSNRILFVLLILPVLSSLHCSAFSQISTPTDSVSKFCIEKINTRNLFPEILNENGADEDISGLINATALPLNRTDIFLDSLRLRASRRLVTRKIYDLIIVRHEPENKSITSQSDKSYLELSGKKIRRIEIRRLSVFGTNISNPFFSDPNKLESLLNKTHINTNENIIRKNLLFREGDTLSPLILSDNERILRQLPYIDDAKVLAIPVSDEEADILIITKDVYTLSARVDFKSVEQGSFSVFEKNIFGMGHEFGVDIPYDNRFSDSPGFGVRYLINNISRSFINLSSFYLDGLGKRSFGFDLGRQFVSSTTKYAGGISIVRTYTTEDLDSLSEPEPLRYNLQNYWISRSFLIDREAVSRIIIGARYTNNNVFSRPFILPNSYYKLQSYSLFLGSIAFSVQKYYKTSLIYSYGRTEDIPHGGLYRITAGREINEFKKRTYLGVDLSIGESNRNLGYFYASAALSAFLNNNRTEQGTLILQLNYFSNLLTAGRFRVRNFVNLEYTRGFDRYTDERIFFKYDHGFEGFRNDSISGLQRFTASLETVLFSPLNFYGFRFAFFANADLSILAESNELMGNGFFLSGLGFGVRIRNDNLILNTLQIRFSIYPNLPPFSRANYLKISGEQLLKPRDFNTGQPQIIPYR